MASMSYCRFENTSEDFKACLNDLEEACSFEDLDHSSYEESARESLYYMAKKYIKQYEFLMSQEEELEDFCF